MPFSPINPTKTSATSTLGSGFNITGASGVFQATGWTITLPGPGTYFVYIDIRGTINATAGANAFLSYEFFNTTDGAVVSGSVRFGPFCGQLSIPVINTTPIQKIITVTASKTIALYAARNNGTTYSLSSVDAGNTEGGYFKLA